MSDAFWNNLPLTLTALGTLISILATIRNGFKLNTVDNKAQTAIDVTLSGNKAIENLHDAINGTNQKSVDAALLASQQSQSLAVEVAMMKAQAASDVKASDLLDFHRDDTAHLRSVYEAELAELRRQLGEK